ncbi:MAG: TetR/AcrR family transcriptional regulator [Bryobacteraceae bacterium]
MAASLATRESILRAAETVAIRDGGNSLTLDRVAREAGVSKGGLLYHFSSKEELLRGLVRRLIDHFDQDLAAYFEQDAEAPPGRRTRAFVKATVHGAWDERAGLGPDRLNAFVALLAAFATDPRLLEPLRERYMEFQRQIEEDGIDPARATVARLAADGLWLHELLGLAPLDAKVRDEVIEEMMRLTRRPQTDKAKRRSRTTAR